MTTKPSRKNRQTLYIAFVGLALLIMVALGLSLGLFRHLAGLHQAAVTLNRQTAEEISRFDRVENLEADLDAPANDIFLSRDPARERARVVKAADAFRKEAEAFRSSLDRSGHRHSIARLDEAVAVAAVVERDSHLVIDAFARGDLDAASRTMAATDQAHKLVFDVLQAAQKSLRAKESKSLSEQQKEFSRTGAQEKSIAIVLLVLAVAVLIYGRSAAMEMITAGQREAYVEELRQREAELTEVVRKLDQQTRSFEEAQTVASLGSWQWDVPRNRVEWSPELHRIFGTSPQTLEPSFEGYLAHVHPADREGVERAVHGSMENRQPFHLEHRILRTDGTEAMINSRGNVETDASGAVIRMYGIAHDITNRKHAEVSIKRLHRTTDLILKSAADGLFGVDLNGVSTFVNPAAAHILGYEPDELEGKQMHEIIHGRHEDGRSFPWQDSPSARTMADGAGRRTTGVFWSKTGKAIPVDFTSTAMVDDQGVVTGAVITFRDISQQLVVDRMKDEFVSTVSHELRTPLTSIRGALGLLVSGRLGVMPEKAARLLEIASSNTDRLVRLINDILDIERMESGKATLIKSPANAVELIRQATDTMQQMAGEAGITIVVDAESVPLYADPDRIVQTLTNLIGNAVKFSPPQTTIRVTAKATDGNVLFRVADQGRGIPAEKLQLVFERFKQVDASDSRDKGGSGLGLAICRSIVRQHGGEIWVQSEAGRGSEFFFTIPLSAGQKNAEVLTPETTGPDRLVYVCDDDEDARQVMSALLSAHGYRVVEFTGGAAVVRASIHQRPDLVLLDIFMPDMNGWETLSRFKTDARIADIPVVIVSVLSPDECESPYAGLHGWLHKPLEEGEFFQTVTDALRSGAPSRRILVVEDDADLARIIASSFERYGLEVIIASTGQQAIDLAATMVPDLLVLDLLLPEVDGFGVIDWIKDHKLWQNVPLIVYSALETTPSQQARLRLGTTEFITKSTIRPEEFERRVLQLLDRITESNRPSVAPGVESVQ